MTRTSENSFWGLSSPVSGLRELVYMSQVRCKNSHAYVAQRSKIHSSQNPCQLNLRSRIMISFPNCAGQTQKPASLRPLAPMNVMPVFLLCVISHVSTPFHMHKDSHHSDSPCLCWSWSPLYRTEGKLQAGSTLPRYLPPEWLCHLKEREELSSPLR